MKMNTPAELLQLISLVLVVVFLWLLARRQRRMWLDRRARALGLSHVDDMTGEEFERYCAAVLSGQGFSVGVTTPSGNLGVDLVAEKDGVRYAIQVKRQRTFVSRRAISDAVAARGHCGCSRALVITNSYFTREASVLAEKTRCALVDRDLLAEWISAYQSNTQPAREAQPHKF